MENEQVSKDDIFKEFGFYLVPDDWVCSITDDKEFVLFYIDFDPYLSIVNVSNRIIIESFQLKGSRIKISGKFKKSIDKIKPSLIMELDDVLLYSTVYSANDNVNNFDFTVNLSKNNSNLVQTNCAIELRPYLKEFLNKTKDKYNLVIYSLGSKEYVYKIVETITKKFNVNFDKVFTRDNSFNCFKFLNICLSREQINSGQYLIIDSTKYVWDKNRFFINFLDTTDYKKSNIKDNFLLNLSNILEENSNNFNFSEIKTLIQEQYNKINIFN